MAPGPMADLYQAAGVVLFRYVAAHELERDRQLNRSSPPGLANAPAMR
jgi:hypothetical protein